MFLRKYFIISVFLFFQIEKISCDEGSTLAFAIDDTISMLDDIAYVKKGAKAIMNLVFSKKSSTIKDLVLVTINDPNVILRTKTSSRKTFLDHLNGIRTNNWRNYDCEEMSLTGMEKALENSRPGSYIYVFTDANAKDHYKLNKIKNLCQKKQSQVVIVFSIAPDCYRPHEMMFTVYYDIAKACSGQVFIVQKDQVDSVLKTIETLLQGKNTIFKWITVPRTDAYVPIKFELDKKAEYAIVSTSGQNVYLKVTTDRSFSSPEPALIRTMWNNNGKVVKLIRPKSGTYYAWVMGQSTISVVVYGRTDFTFEHGFSVLTPKSMADTAKQPIAGLRQHMSIKVTDPDKSVTIKTVQILDINHNDRIINELPLRHIGTDFYISDAFVWPKSTFRIAVKGEIKRTSEKIIRTSRTNIDPSFKDYIPDSAPIVKIDEGLKLNVNYGSAVSLTCKVTAHPAPTIKWYTSSGRFLSSESSVVDDPLFVSYLKLKDIKKNETYVCKASNKKGNGRESRIEVGVRSAFTYSSNSKARPIIKSTNRNINVTKGGKIELKCKISQGYPKPQVEWFKKNANSYTQLSNVKSEILTVNKALLTHAGQYKCKATNAMGADSATLDVTVSSLPEISGNETKREVPFDGNVNFTCKVEAYPPPSIVWKDEKGSLLQSKLTKTSEFEHYNRLTLQNVRRSAVYICEASNSVGIVTKDFEITVRPPFEVKKNIQDTVYDAKYGQSVKIPCNIKSYLPITIKWYRSGKQLSGSSGEYNISEDGSELTLNSMNIGMQGKYTCEATLNSDPTVKQTQNTDVKLTGLARPVIQSTNRNINVTKGGKIELKCKISQGYPKPQVEWFKKNANSYTQLSNVKSEILTVNKALLTHAGQYKCKATNAMGADSATLDVTVSSLPEISGNETKREVPFDGNVNFTCKVEAYPPPSIVWKDEKGSLLQSKLTKTSEFEHYNRLTLQNVRRSAVYICEASNSVGIVTKDFEITVRPPFEVKKNIQDTVYDVKYGQSVKIPCNIKSYLPITIKWYRSGKQLSGSSGEYNISEDGSELTLNSMNIGMQGKYTCEATLNSDPTVKQTQNTDVKLTGLARPVIQSTNRNINVTKGGKIELKCKISQGYPKPQVEWFKKYANSYTQLSNVKSEILTVNKALLMNAGQYKCKASNGIGADSATFDVAVSSLPEISATETKREVPYDGNVDFTCKVEAYPPPSIVWKDEKGSVLQSKVTKTSEFVFYNRLTLQNVRRSAVYICETSNSVGIVTKDFEVAVRPPFEVKKHIQAYDTKYGQSVRIPCNIKSYLPITIKWYRSGKQLSVSSGEYDISRDGSELTLNSMNIGMQGKYTCEATLNSDPTIKKTHDTDVKISGLARPEIQSTNRNINVTKGGKIELKCKIGQGYPKPQIEWFKKNANSYTPIPNVNSETLTVNKALLTHTGQYKCKATNGIGADSATFDVTVSSLPEISATETKRVVPFDGNVDFTCEVEAYLPPSIVWKDEKGSVLQSKVTKISEFVFYNRLTLQNVRRSAVYICEASNIVGTATKDFEITARPLFEVKNHIKRVIGIPYGSKETLRCDIKSTKPMSIRWYRQMTGVKSSRSVISSSDNYTISGDGTELIIKSMTLDLSGKYTCEASVSSFPTEKVAYSVQVNVVGVGPPEVTYYTTVMNGKNFTAICRIKGVPKPIISWQFKSKGSEEFTSIPGSEEELNIPELRLQHTGVYKCIAENNFGKTEHDFNVVVEERPIIFLYNEESTQYGVEGDLVMTIPCNVTGFPEPTIVWKKGGEALKTGPKYEVKRTTLYINKPVTSDSAEYTCEAKNELGTDMKTSVVEIVDNFEGDDNFNGDSHDIYAEQGKSKTIKCNLKNAGEDSVRWYMDGLLTKQAGSTYTIERASVSEEGNYTCRVNTNEGSISETFVLYVGFRPIFEDNSPSPQTINWTDDDQMLDCAADSQPPATYEWLHNGKVLPGNDLKQKHITDWGEYTCKVSNVLGYIQKIFQVTTSGCYITKNIATQHQPLISNKDEPTWPLSADNSGILLKENEEIKLSCPNNGKSANNFKMIQSKKEITAKCSTQDRFIVEGNIYRYSDLQCNTKVESSVLRTQNQCSGPNSEMIRVGFAVNGFMDAYKVCYDKTLNVPLYASVSTFISKNGVGVDQTKFEWSSAPELSNRKTGNWKPARSCKCCYTQGQLVNVNELAFGPAQAATFKDNLNSVPIWNPKCNNSSRTSWEFFDNETREIIISEKLSSWTGASEYVPKDGGLVPRYIWKVINYDEVSTVMVYVNDKYPEDSDVRCSSPCESMMEADKFLYCCTLEEFTKKFGMHLDTLKAV